MRYTQVTEEAKTTTIATAPAATEVVQMIDLRPRDVSSFGRVSPFAGSLDQFPNVLRRDRHPVLNSKLKYSRALDRR
jgi:hypothetical protein